MLIWVGGGWRCVRKLGSLGMNAQVQIDMHEVWI